MSQYIIAREAPTIVKYGLMSFFPVLLGIGITLLTFGFWSKDTIEDNRLAHKIAGIVMLVLGTFLIWTPLLGPLIIGVGIVLTTFGFMSFETFEDRRTSVIVTGIIMALIGSIGSIKALTMATRDSERIYHDYF